MEEVIHLPEEGRFEIRIGEHVAELLYYVKEGNIVFTHTGVPRPLEGQGIGSRLVRAGLEYARQEGYRVVPLCSFVDAYIRRHPEYQDLRHTP
ncbi:MAG: N-acetyltransferase [Anaerolineae bacterium]|nr:MAG: N-acetyltransferase [Anaerolineae bacterium]